MSFFLRTADTNLAQNGNPLVSFLNACAIAQDLI